MHGGHTPPRWELDGKFQTPQDFIRAAAETRSGKGLKCGFNDNQHPLTVTSRWRSKISLLSLCRGRDASYSSGRLFN